MEKYTLGQVSTNVSYGYTASANSIPIGPKFLRITDIIPYFINWNNVPYCSINNNLISRYKLERGDVVIARTGATTGYNAVIDADINSIFASFLIRFRLNQNIVFPKFIKYILKSDFYKDFIANHIGGSAQPGINAKTLSLFPINLPPIEEQKRIAGVLGAFDDKIELLQKQNTTLENMAKALFKSWFVDFDVVHAKQQGQPKAAVMQQYHLTEELYNLFPSSFEPSSLGPIPTGWQVKKIGDITKITSGKRPKSTVDVKDTNFIYPVYGGNGIKWWTNSPLYTTPIIITGRVGTLGQVYRIYSPVWISDNALIFEPERTDFEFLFYFLNRVDFSSLNRGSTQPLITQGDIKNIDLLYSSDIILQFHNITVTYEQKIQTNNKQIQTLTEMRDALLPYLISGKIRV